MALFVLVSSGGSDSAADAPAPDWKPVPGKKLVNPAQVRPDRRGTVHVKLSAVNQTITVSGSPLGAVPFDAGMPGSPSLNGPTIHVRPGGTIKVTFTNKLGPQGDNPHPPTNIHYHGLHTSPRGRSDNIFRTFDNGKTYESVVRLPRDHSTGTFWYHVHFHGLSEAQVMGGLSGLLVVDGLKSLLPKPFRAIRQRQLALRDVQTSDGKILGQGQIGIQQPSTRLVNALYKPRLEMRENRYELWQLANIGADVFYQLAFRQRAKPTNQARFAIIAEDGLPVWRVTTSDTLLLPPGKRFDVLVIAKEPGTYDLVSLPYAQHNLFAAASPGPPPTPATLVPKPIPVETNSAGVNVPVTQTLATARVLPSPTSRPVSALPRRLAPKLDFSHGRVAEKRTFRFQSTSTAEDPFVGMINDTVFSPHEMPLAAPVKNTLEEWTLVNQTTDDHPFHIHINDFQVMSVNGKPYRSTGHQDIVTIPAQTLVDGALVDGQVVIRQKYKRFTGWYVFHCHILGHEDAGMMATIQVRDKASDPIRQPPEFRGPDPGHGHGG